MPRLILCADDFAFSEAVSETIAGLARAGRLNATCCMTLMPGWRHDSALLRDLPAHVQVGLHLVLTGEQPLTPMPQLAPDGRLPSIHRLQKLAASRRLPLDEVAHELTAQFEAFTAALGRAPDFVDGHQHVHVLPGIRAIVLALAAARAPGCWLRNCDDRLRAMLARPFAGKALASAWRSRGIAAEAAALGLGTNDGFAGHYAFRGDYARIFPRFLHRPGDTHLVMCHPGAGLRAGDDIAEARIAEAAALAALPLPELAAAAGLSFPA